MSPIYYILAKFLKFLVLESLNVSLLTNKY